MTSLPTFGAAGTPVPAAQPCAAPVAQGNPASPRTTESPSVRGGAGPQLATGMARLAAAMTEAELERQVRAICRDLGVLVYHTFDSRRSEPGFPDLVLVGRGVLYRELKRETGRLTSAQRTWLAALGDAGQNAGTWRPSDLICGDVARQLAALAGIGAR